MFCSAKDKTKITQKKSHIVYEIQCPTCREYYVSKNDWCFVTRLNEHGFRLALTYFLDRLSLLNLLIYIFNTAKVELGKSWK